MTKAGKKAKASIGFITALIRQAQVAGGSRRAEAPTEKEEAQQPQEEAEDGEGDSTSGSGC